MEDKVWKTLWKIKVPPKVLHLIWKALTNCLPTRTQLYSKHVPVHLTCPFCHTEEESITHVLLQCHFSKSCWNRSGLATPPAHSDSFFLWFKDVADRNKPDLLEEVVMLCWSIWQARNGVLWNQKSYSAADVMFTACLTLAQWKNANSRKFEPLLVPSGTYDSGERWVKPAVNMLKINVDGAVFHADNAYGSGVVIRDNTGSLIEAFSVYNHGCNKPEIAEMVGIKEALSWIKKKEDQVVQGVIVETDCLVALQALHTSIRMPSLFGLLVSECHEILYNLQNVEICFVKRSANRVAHCVARNSCYWSGCHFVEGSIPMDLHSLLIADLVD
ncbi:hypothetical protein CsatA_027941 [Cannabis sativa]